MDTIRAQGPQTVKSQTFLQKATATLKWGSSREVERSDIYKSSSERPISIPRYQTASQRTSGVLSQVYNSEKSPEERTIAALTLLTQSPPSELRTSAQALKSTFPAALSIADFLEKKNTVNQNPQETVKAAILAGEEIIKFVGSQGGFPSSLSSMSPQLAFVREALVLSDPQASEKEKIASGVYLWASLGRVKEAQAELGEFLFGNLKNADYANEISKVVNNLDSIIPIMNGAVENEERILRTFLSTIGSEKALYISENPRLAQTLSELLSTVTKREQANVMKMLSEFDKQKLELVWTLSESSSPQAVGEMFSSFAKLGIDGTRFSKALEIGVYVSKYFGGLPSKESIGVFSKSLSKLIPGLGAIAAVDDMRQMNAVLRDSRVPETRFLAKLNLGANGIDAGTSAFELAGAAAVLGVPVNVALGASEFVLGRMVDELYVGEKTARSRGEEFVASDETKVAIGGIALATGSVGLGILYNEFGFSGTKEILSKTMHASKGKVFEEVEEAKTFGEGVLRRAINSVSSFFSTTYEDNR